MNRTDIHHDTRGIPGHTTPTPGTVILGATEDGILDESAITDAAYLADLENMERTLDEWQSACPCVWCAANAAVGRRLTPAEFAAILRSPFVALVKLGGADSLIRDAYAMEATP